MASEILAVPEDDLLAVIGVIRAGLKVAKYVPKDVRRHLKKWCDEEEAYVKGLADD